MAKKSRRQRRAQAEKVVKPAQPIQPAATPAVVKTQQNSNFTEDYYYVYTDIRFLIVVTIVMIAAMVGLSYII